MFRRRQLAVRKRPQPLEPRLPAGPGVRRQVIRRLPQDDLRRFRVGAQPVLHVDLERVRPALLKTKRRRCPLGRADVPGIQYSFPAPLPFIIITYRLNRQAKNSRIPLKTRADILIDAGPRAAEPSDEGRHRLNVPGAANVKLDVKYPVL